MRKQGPVPFVTTGQRRCTSRCRIAVRNVLIGVDPFSGTPVEFVASTFDLDVDGGVAVDVREPLETVDVVRFGGFACTEDDNGLAFRPVGGLPFEVFRCRSSRRHPVSRSGREREACRFGPRPATPRTGHAGKLFPGSGASSHVLRRTRPALRAGSRPLLSASRVSDLLLVEHDVVDPEIGHPQQGQRSSPIRLGGPVRILHACQCRLVVIGGCLEPTMSQRPAEEKRNIEAAVRVSERRAGHEYRRGCRDHVGA